MFSMWDVEEVIGIRCGKWKCLILVRMSRTFWCFLAPKKCTSLPVEKIGFEERFSKKISVRIKVSQKNSVSSQERRQETRVFINCQ